MGFSFAAVFDFVFMKPGLLEQTGVELTGSQGSPGLELLILRPQPLRRWPSGETLPLPVVFTMALSSWDNDPKGRD